MTKANKQRCIQDRELAGSTPASSKCCDLEQDTLFTLFSIGFYPGRSARNTHKIGRPARNTQKMRVPQY